jgi:Haem-NO-binding
MAIDTYPDEEAVAIVTAASQMTHTPADQILEDFGEFIAPDLLRMYQSLLKPEWKTLELLLHTEEMIHRVVRIKNPGAEPPKLQFEQAGPNQLKFYYNSPRRMAAVAKGIIKGIAKHYRETVLVREHKKPDGSSEMLITVR